MERVMDCETEIQSEVSEGEMVSLWESQWEIELEIGKEASLEAESVEPKAELGSLKADFHLERQRQEKASRLGAMREFDLEGLSDFERRETSDLLTST
jgi:hypothetical protein